MNPNSYITLLIHPPTAGPPLPLYKLHPRCTMISPRYHPNFQNPDMSNATFTRELSRPLTYANLTTHYLGHSNTLRSSLPTITFPRDVTRTERVLEILLMGIRLCHGQIGSPAEINTLVDRRISEIQRERISFVPDPFAEYQKKKGEIEVYEDEQSETEQWVDMDDEDQQNEYDDEEYGPDNFLSPFAPRHVSPSSSVYSQDSCMGYNINNIDNAQAPIYPSSPSLSPASSTPSPSPSSSDRVDLWCKLIDSLNETLYGYMSIYAHTPHKYSDYQPTINLLQDALRIAR
jgi:hypothetical protein